MKYEIKTNNEFKYFFIFDKERYEEVARVYFDAVPNAKDIILLIKQQLCQTI